MRGNLKNIAYISIYLLLCSFCWYAPNKNLNSLDLEIIYNFQRNNYESNYSLMANNSIVLWEEISDFVPRKNANVNFERIDKYMRKKTYTNLKDSTIISNMEIMKQKFYIKEKIPNLNWKLSDSTQHILGYQCNMAKTNFRGREYIAFYTNDILINIGPWKFQGLPGLILKIESYSHDEYYNIEAIELKRIRKKSKEYFSKFNKFKKKYKRKFQSWNDFKNDVSSFIDNVIKYHKSNLEHDINDEEGKSGFRLINYLEIFHNSQKKTVWYD